MAISTDALLAMLQDKADDAATVSALDEQLVKAERWSDVLALLPTAARGLSEAVQRGRFLIRAASVAAGRLSDSDAAAALYGEVRDLDLPDDSLLSAFQQAFAATQAWADQAAALQAFARVTQVDSQQGRLLFAAGRILEDRLYDHPGAIKAYQLSFRLYPHVPDALHAARAIYAQADEWATVVKLYTYELRIPLDDRSKARVWKELGQVQMNRLSDNSSALESFRQALALDPDLIGLQNVIAQLSGEALTLEESVLDELVPQTDTADDSGPSPGLEVVDASEVEPMDVQLTQSDAEMAGDPGAADLEIEPDVSAVAPEGVDLLDVSMNTEVLETEEAPQTLDEVAEVAVVGDAAEAEVVEPELEVEASAEAAADDATESESESGAPTEAPGLTEAPSDGEVDSAAPAVEPASVEAVPADSASPTPQELAIAARAARNAERTTGSAPLHSTLSVRVGTAPDGTGNAGLVASERWTAWLESVVDRAGSSEPESALQLMAVAIEYGRKLGTSDDVLASWAMQALERTRDGIGAVRALYPALHGARAVWDELVSQLEVLSEGDEVLTGALYGVKFYALCDVAAAIALAPSAGPVAVLEQSLVDVAAKGNWRKTQQGLQDAHRGGGDAEAESYRAQTWIALGLGSEEKAMDSMRRVLRAYKYDEGAATMLRALYLKGEKSNELATLLKSVVAAVPESERERRSLLLREQLYLYRDVLQQDPLAVTTLLALVDVDDTDVALIDQLSGKLRELGRFPDLIEVLKKKAKAVDSDTDRIVILEEVAQLYVEKFNNQNEAIKAWEAILQLDPSNESALRSLEDGYDKRRMWDELISVKRRLVELTYDAAGQAQLLRTAADIAATKKRDVPLSIELWTEVLQSVPGDGDALLALEQIYERDKQWAQLADVLQQRVELLSEPSERSAALLKLGMVAGDRLNQTERSLDAWTSLLALEPDNFRAKDAVRKGLTELQKWDELEQFYARDGAWAEYVRQIESLAGSVGSDELRIDLLRRAARVWTDELNDHGRAVKNLEKVLQIDSSDATSAARLAPTYRERGDFKRLAPVLEVLLGAAADSDTRYQLQVELARIWADRLKDDATSLSWYAAAQQEAPSGLSILDEIDKVAGRSGAWATVETILEAARSSLAGRPEQVAALTELSLRLGRVLDAELSRPDDALVCYDEVLLQEPSNEAALDAKDQIFTRLGRWEDLLDVIVVKLDAVLEPAARIALLERMSVLHEDSRGDLSSAIVSWNEVLDLAPTHAPAFAALLRLYRSTEDFDSLARTMEKLLDLHPREVDEARWLSQSVALAQVQVENLERYDAALVTLREVVGAAPGHTGARALLERLLQEPDFELSAAQILAPLYEADRNWAAFVAMLEIQVAASSDAASGAALLRRIGTVQSDELADPSSSSDAWARLIRLVPTDAMASSRLEALAAEIDGWASLVRLYEELVEELAYGAADAQELAVDLASRASSFCDARLGDLDEAIRLRGRVLEIRPGHAATLSALDGLLSRAERWEELLANCADRLSQASGVEERRAILLQSAQIHEGRLDDSTAAIEAYRAILALNVQDSGALGELDRLFGQSGDALNQANIVRMRAELASPASAAQFDLLNRLADLMEDDIGDIAGAIEVRRGILTQAPGNRPASERLQSLLANEDFASAAASILEPIYESSGDHAGLVQLLEVLLQTQSEPSLRRATFGRIVDLHEQALDDRAAAYEAIERALSEFLGDASLTATAIRLAGALDSWKSLASHLEGLADEAVDPQVQRDTLALVAGLREERLSDIESAVSLWERVADANPQDTEALDSLERLHQQTGNWQALVDVLLRKSELPESWSNSLVRLGLMFRAAELYEAQLAEPTEAINLLTQVLAMDPTNLSAIEQLERLYTSTGSWEELVENYQRRLALTRGADERRELNFAMGRVLETELEDPDRAIAAYRVIVDEKADDIGALSALDRLYAQTENWHELLWVLNAESANVDDMGQAHALRVRIGQLQESELMSPADAVATYGAILSEDVSLAEARRCLLAMARRGEETAAVYRLMEPIYRTEGGWEELIELNTLRVASSDDVIERRNLQADTARIHEEQLGSLEDAWSSWASVLREGVRLADVDQLVRLAEPLQRWLQTVELMEELWDAEGDPAIRTTLGLRVAGALDERLGDAEKAIEAYVRVLDENPTEASALEALDDLYSRTEQWSALAAVIQQRVNLTSDRAAGTMLRLRLAGLYSDALDSPMDAISVFREVLVQSPTNEPALSALESMAAGGIETSEVSLILDPLLRQSGSWDRLVSLYDARIREADGSDEKYRLWLEVADIHETSRKDAGATLSAVGAALCEMPSDMGLKERLESLGQTTGAWRSVAGVYTSLLAQELDDSDRFDAATRLALVLSDRLEDAAGAESAWRIALDVEPASERALRALDVLLTQRSDWDGLSDVIGRLREVVYSPPELSALTLRHAVLFEEQLGALPEAVKCLQEVLDIDPTRLDAMDRLLSLFERTGQWSELYDALERKADFQTDETSRALVLEQMAGLATDRLDRFDDAIDLWSRVAESRGMRDWKSLQQLAALYRQTEQSNELAATLDRLIDLAPDEITRGELLQESGYLWAEVLDNQDLAILRYRRILEIIEDEPNALMALRVLYERTAQYGAFVSTVERLLELSLIPSDELPAVHEQLGEIHTDILGDHTRAVRSWNSLLALVPGHLGALDRLDQLHTQASEWRPLVDVLEQRLLTVEEGADKVELLKRIAGLWRDSLGDNDQAIEAYNRILDIDLFEFEAGAAYEQLLTRLERWDELVGYHLDRADNLTDLWEKRQERSAAATLYEHKLGRADAAFLVVSSSAQESPLDEELHTELGRLATLSGQEAALAETLARMLATVSDDTSVERSALVPLLVIIGETQDKSLNKPEFAEPYYSRALDIDPENERVLLALESIYERTDDPEMLVGILKRRALLAFDPAEQTRLYNRIGGLYLSSLNDLTEATEAYRMSVRIDDTDAIALAALEGIYEQSGRWRELIEILELQCNGVFETAPLRDLRFRIASTWNGRLQNVERAVEAYKDVLGIAPDDLASLEALEKLYAAAEKWDRYLDVLEQKLNLAKDIGSRSVILFKQASVYETAMDDIDRAVDCLNAILSADSDSLQAIEELERLFNEHDRPTDLVEVYERHVAAVTEPEAKAAVLTAMARTWVDALGDVYRGIDTYTRVLQYDATNLVALERLGLLYEEVGDAPRAIEMYERLSDVSPVQQVRAEKLFRAGELFEGEQGDLNAATERYQKVLQIEPSFVAAMQAMQRVYMTGERWVDAIEMIEAQFDYNRDLASRSMLMVAIGAINEEHLANQPAAQRRYEEALELEPSNVFAAEPLGRMYYADRKWERARSVLELLVNSPDFEKSDAVAADLYSRLGRVNEELTFDEEAQRWYEKARQTGVPSPEALLGLARILRRAGSIEQAYALNMEIVSHYRNALTTDMYAELYFQCAEIKAELGDLHEARSLFEQVLQIDPRHLISLKKLAALFEQMDDQSRLAEVRFRLYEVTEDPRTRMQLITQVGDAWMAANDFAEAEKAFREALRLDPESKLVLNKLLNVFVAAEKWERASEVLGKLSQIESDPMRQSQYFFTIGSIFRDQLGKPSEALDFFNKALDIQPMNLAPFEAIEKLVTEARDWNTQQREYRRMLARVVPIETEEAIKLRFVLLKNLGEVYRSRMQDVPRAIDSFRAAFAMQPEDEGVARILAELYERTGANGPEVIELHQKLISLSLSRFESYHALFKAFLSAREFDKAWCVSAALTLFSKHTPEQEAYYKRYLTPQVQQARRSLSDDMWARLIHPDVDPAISRIFATIANGIREDYAQDIKRWQINKRRDRIDPAQPMPLTAMLRYSFERVNVPKIEVYATQAYNGLYNANLDPAGLVAGPDMLAGKSERELAFICTKTVALCRPEYYLGSAFNATDSLKIFFYAAIALVTGQAIGDAPVDIVRGYVEALMRMPEPVVALLRNQVAAYLSEARNPDLSAWLRGIDHTANRVGLLFSGDIRTAAECIRNEPAPIGKETQKDRLVQLVMFGLSDDYFTLRKELGLALQA